jgi:hypothetical protein
MTKLRTMQSVWLATSKQLRNMVNQGFCIHLPLCGKFIKREGTVTFMPSLDLVNGGHFKFPENEKNVSPFSKGAQRFMTSKTLSLSGIAATCGLSRELVGAYLKQIFVKFIEQGRQGKLCQLDFEVGKLIAYPNGTL